MTFHFVQLLEIPITSASWKAPDPMGSGNLTGEDDEGETVAKGVLHGGNDVGSTWPSSDDTGSARDTRTTFGHVTCALFMSRENEFKVGGVVGGIEDG
jgi:hypothetical protein